MMGIWAVLALVILAMGFFAVTPALPVVWYTINGIFGLLNCMVIAAFGVLIKGQNLENNVQLQETPRSRRKSTSTSSKARASKK